MVAINYDQIIIHNREEELHCVNIGISLICVFEPRIIGYDSTKYFLECVYFIHITTI